MKDLSELIGVLLCFVAGILLISLGFALFGWAFVFVINLFGGNADLGYWGTAAAGLAIIIVVSVFRK